MEIALQVTKENNPISRRFRERKSHHRFSVSDPSDPMESFADFSQSCGSSCCKLAFLCVQLMRLKKKRQNSQSK
jgi:hypothetical protein